MAIKRGNYKLPHQAQAAKRDFYAEEIGRHLNGKARGYRLKPEVIEKYGQGMYEYLLYTPSHVGTNWIAFRNRVDLGVFLDAYGCTLDSEPGTGDQFWVLLPSSVDVFQPLNGLEHENYIHANDVPGRYKTAADRLGGVHVVDVSDGPDWRPPCGGFWVETGSHEFVTCRECFEVVRSKMVEAIYTAVDNGADLVIEALGLGELESDVANLVVNATVYLAEHPDGTFDEMIEARYDSTPDEVRGWWNWS